MPNPLLLSDFCTASIDRGGLDGMLALNGIFVLMTQHSLEYPQFYDRLYALLEPSAFHANNRKGFFDLLDIFLRSPALPAYLAAAFIKRLARLALRAPPAGAMACVAFVHNLLRRHPGCAVLVHREGKNGAPRLSSTRTRSSRTRTTRASVARWRAHCGRWRHSVRTISRRWPSSRTSWTET